MCHMLDGIAGACCCPAPAESVPGPTAAALQMLPGHTVPAAGLSRCGDNELREATAALQPNCRVITARLPRDRRGLSRAGGGLAARAGCRHKGLCVPTTC